MSGVQCGEAQETLGRVWPQLVRVPPAELAPVVECIQEAEAPPPDAALEPCANASFEPVGGYADRTDRGDVEEIGEGVGEQEPLDVVDVLRRSLDVLTGALWR